MNRLKDIKCGETVKVKKLEGEGATRRRIMDMGREMDSYLNF
ncbi:hypothetical protein ACTPEU_00235 [Clostridioides difficile]